ncbi:hypothetical protein B0J17DRAFT_633173 [Rhizoctonia solani]|nr:hypothetical protein B0J17DRAFT_633173 [Rhizoctonia solani]
MRNLKALYLMTTQEQLAEILGGLGAPFSLDTLIYSGGFSVPLLTFLEQQFSIIRLGWHGLVPQSEVDLLRGSIEANSSLLSRLEYLEGIPDILTALLPLRPISSATILDLHHQVPSHVLGSLSSLVPVTRVCILEDCGATRKLRGGRWLRMLNNLPDWGFPLEELKILTKGTPKLEIGLVRNGTAYDPELQLSKIKGWFRNHRVARLMRLLEWRGTDPVMNGFVGRMVNVNIKRST